MNELTLIVVSNPFSRSDRDIRRLSCDPGMTLLDLRHSRFPRDLPVSVSVNGRIVPTAHLALSRPMPGDQILFVPEVAGGGEEGDDKSIYRTVMMLAIAAGAYAMFGPGGALINGGLWGSLAMGAVLTVGGMLVNALLPPPKTSTEEEDSQSYSWTPQTVQQQGVPVPMVFGTNKLYGNIIESYTDVDSNGDSVLYLLLSLGMGPLANIYDCKINGQDASKYGVVPVTRLGKIYQGGIPGFQQSKIERVVNYQVVYEDGAYTWTSPGEAFDSLEIEAVFPYGVWRLNDEGELKTYSINIRVGVRKLGDPGWKFLTHQVVEDYGQVSQARWSRGYYSVSYTEWNPNDATVVWVEVEQGTTSPTAHFEGEAAIDEQWQQTLWHWLSTTEYVYTSTPVTYVTVSAYSSKVIRKKFVLPGITDKGQYEVYVENMTATLDDGKHGEAFYLGAVREVTSVNLTYPCTALVGLSAVASDQLSGSFEFSCMTDGIYCRIWTGSVWTVGSTDNPAWACYNVLTKPLFGTDLAVLEYKGIDPARIDHVKFKEWADWCDELVPDGLGGTEKRITFNGVFDSSGNMWESAFRICQTGRAALVRRGTLISVMVDKPAEPVQLFTAGNINRREFSETWLPMDDRANELDVDIVNADNDYERETITCHNPGLVTEASPAKMELFGITTRAGAWRAARYRLACNQYILSCAELGVDVDAVACETGDVINVQHDLPTAGSVGGRVVSATVSSVTIDRTVTIEADTEYALWVRLQDDTILSRVVSNAPGDYTMLTVSTPFAAAPQLHDVYAFGESAKVVKPYRVIGIKPQGNLMCTLSLVEYNASIYLTDELQPALPTPDYSSLETLPPITDLLLVELLYAASDGTIRDALDVYWSKPLSSAYASADVYFSVDGGGWTLAGNTTSDTLRIDNVQINADYAVAVVTVNILGAKDSIENAPQAELSTLGKMRPPTTPADFAAGQNGQFVEFSWTHIADADLWGYELRRGTDWDTARVIVTGVSADAYSWQAELDGTYRFLIKAIDTSGNYSVTAASVDITLTGIEDNINVILSQNEISKEGGPDGVMTNFVFADDTPPYMTMPWMLTDTDVPALDDTSAGITDYAGDIILTAQYETLSIDTGKIGKTTLRIVDVIDAYDLGATDQSYPTRLDTDYPADTDTHVTMPASADISVKFSDDNVTWSAYEPYTGTVEKSFRYVKVKYAADIASTTARFHLTSLAISLDVPDVTFVLSAYAVAATTGSDVSFATYSLAFYSAPVIWAQLVGGSGSNVVPDISSVTTTGFHIDAIDKSDAKVAANFDIHIQGY